MENHSDNTLACMTAVKLAEELNADARARMAASSGLLVGKLSTNHLYWESMGVVTGLDLSNHLDACVAREREDSH